MSRHGSSRSQLSTNFPGKSATGGPSVARPWTSTYSGRSWVACARVWKAIATWGFRRMRSSFFGAPTELFTVTTPFARSWMPKFETGASTTPPAGVT